jgi:hypothetical protein
MQGSMTIHRTIMRTAAAMQGSTTIRRTIIRTVALVLGASALFPLAADASTLLSGYGGPGQGNQAILGSALVNGPRSGGGGGSGAAGGSATTASASSLAATGSGVAEAPTASAAPKTSGPLGKRSPGPARRHVSAAGTRQNPLAGRASPAVNYPAVERGAGHTSVALGLSGEQLLYAILAFGTLMSLALLTSRLARTAAVRDGNS